MSFLEMRYAPASRSVVPRQTSRPTTSLLPCSVASLCIAPISFLNYFDLLARVSHMPQAGLPNMGLAAFVVY
jgi:hypothetical protein